MCLPPDFTLEATPSAFVAQRTGRHGTRGGDGLAPLRGHRERGRLARRGGQDRRARGDRLGHHGAAAGALQGDREVVRANAPLQLEMSDEDGSHTYMSTKFPLRRPDGEAWGVGGIATDITARKRAEEEATRARHEAERANRAKSVFLSRMSHELRTPLAAVLGFGQLLEMSDLETRQRESVEQILKGGRHLKYSGRPSMANLLVTLMDKMDYPVEKVGGSTGKLSLDTVAL